MAVGWSARGGGRGWRPASLLRVLFKTHLSIALGQCVVAFYGHHDYVAPLNVLSSEATVANGGVSGWYWLTDGFKCKLLTRTHTHAHTHTCIHALFTPQHKLKMYVNMWYFIFAGCIFVDVIFVFWVFGYFIIMKTRPNICWKNYR